MSFTQVTNLLIQHQILRHSPSADLKPDNMMARLEDKSILERSATDEFENPLPQKICDDHTVYLSRNQYGHPTNMAKVLGIITITDFGFAVHGDGPHYGSIQVEPFRAPEVILDAGWSYSTDIWNLGLWDLLEEHSLFKAIDRSNTEYDERTHLAYIEALLGPPPKDLLLRGRRSSMFYNSSGQLEPPLDLPVIDFETSINQINGEEKRMFIKFVKKMLTWEPKDRQTAKELLDDPWLHTSFLEENSSHVP
ncbi:MAG: hypothetical protein M1820_009733 [Bogoriella megaspora]|nr:MAG: hypothetical protein M1820_009733 [Bogoriella megaspora]